MNLEDQIRNIPDLKTRLDRYMELQGGRTVMTSEVSAILGLDTVGADRYLEEWGVKHDKDCSTVSVNPRGVKVYPTILKDPQIRLQGEVRKRKIVARKKYWDARREWDDL